jgi:hypothetical protein
MKTTEILEQLSIAQLKSKVNQYPALVFEQKKIVRVFREAYKDAEQERATQEAMIVADISSAVNPATGKTMFSNAESRQAELLKQKRVSRDYLDAKYAAKQVEMDLNQAQDKLDMLFDEYKSALFVADLVAAEVKLWARELTEVKPALMAETDFKSVA